MPVYPKSEGKWRIRVWMNGTRHDQVLAGSKREALAEEARWRLELARTDAAWDPRRSVDFATFSTTVFKADAKKSMRPSTWKARTYQLAQLAPHFGHLLMSNIGAADVEAFKDDRIEAEIQPVTINTYLRVLQRVLAVARKHGTAVRDFKIEMLPEVVIEKDPWTAAEVAKLIATCAEVSPAIKPIVVFLANTGCRKGEALALTWAHVEMDRRQIRIWPSKEWQPKSGKPRELPMSDALHAELKALPRKSKYVFPTREKTRYAYWPQLQFDTAREKAGLEGGPHKLRHTYATHFLASTPDLPLLARYLGHSSTWVTARYAHLLPDHTERGRNAVNFSGETVPSAVPAFKIVKGGKR